MGGSADQIHRHVADHYTADMSCRRRCGWPSTPRPRQRRRRAATLTAESLEVAILDRDRPRRFRRVTTPELDDLLAASGTAPST